MSDVDPTGTSTLVEDYRRPTPVGDISLATLLVNPLVFASIADLIGLGNFRIESETVTLTPNQVYDITMENPRQYFTLLLYANIVVSSPVVRMEVIKDNVSDPSIQAFSVFDSQLPKLYTPFRNTASIRLTNLSGISSPSVVVTYYRLQIQTAFWNTFRRVLQSQLMQNVPGMVLPNGGR